MKQAVVGATLLLAVVLWFAVGQPQRTVRPAAVASGESDLSFRVVFGYQRTVGKTYDGSVSVTGGALKAIEPWEFLQGDSITPPNAWKLRTRRVVFENQPDQVYPYLRQNRGICMEHSLATGQGTDWRDNDPDLEPLVENYQGYHAAYEYAGGPPAESAANNLIVHGSFEPAGFYWNAPAKGYKLGVQASSQLMGNIFTASRGLKLRAKVGGTDIVTRVDLNRNNAVIYSVVDVRKKDVDFEYVDRSPVEGTNWYYVRVSQLDRNLAWSSPVWVNYQ